MQNIAQIFSFIDPQLKLFDTKNISKNKEEKTIYAIVDEIFRYFTDNSRNRIFREMANKPFSLY